MTSPTRRVVPVLMSGGAGTRLWPLSRELTPKHLLPLTGDKSLLQAAAVRVRDSTLFGAPLVIASAAHGPAISDQLKDIGTDKFAVALEPVPRNTAAAAAVAGILVSQEDPEGMLLLMPADHLIPDAELFVRSVRTALSAAAGGSIVLFGIRPDSPATGYGYIRSGAPVSQQTDLRTVEEFVEKPDLQTARGYMESGAYFWNSGIFLLSAKTLVSEMARFAPEVLRQADAAIARASREGEFLRLERHAFERCPSISVDYAVMEHTRQAVVLPAEFAWTDVGSWSSLWEISEKDGGGNALEGNVIAVGTTNSYLRSCGPLIATLGLDNVVVVVTPDAVMVADRAYDQDIKKLVEEMRRKNLAHLTI